MADIYRISTRKKNFAMLLAYICFAFVLYLFYNNIFLSVTGGIGCIFFEKYYKNFCKKKCQKEIREQFKDLLYQISSSISAGRNMERALLDGEAYLSMIYQKDSIFLKELERLNRQISESKVSDNQALSEMAQRCQIDDIDNFVETYEICKESGGDLKSAVAKCTTILIDKMEVEKEIEKMTAQRQIEWMIVAFMPVAVLFFLNVTSASYLEIMYETLQGKVVMTLALTMYMAALKLFTDLFEVEI